MWLLRDSYLVVGDGKVEHGLSIFGCTIFVSLSVFLRPSKLATEYVLIDSWCFNNSE